MTVKLVKLYKNTIFKNKKGNLLKYISTKNSFFKKFGEIYFNYINYNKTKGWNLHKKNNCLLICISGKVKFHIIDRKGKEVKIILDSNNSKILKIPPQVWFSFKSIKSNSIIANFLNSPHKDSEILKSKKIKNYLIE